MPDDNTPEMFTKDQVKDLIKEAVDSEVSGLKAKNADLLDKLTAAKEQSKQWDGLDPDQVKKLINNMNQSDDAKLIAEGKIDEVINKRIDDVNKRFDTEKNQLQDTIKQLTEKQDTLTNEANQYKQNYNTKILEDAIRDEALKQGVVSAALRDVISRAKELFSVSDSGEVEARDYQGNLIKTEDDFLLSPERFIKTLKKEAPHYWPNSASAGAMGGASNINGNDMMEKLSDAAQTDFASYQKLRSQQLAERAKSANPLNKT